MRNINVPALVMGILILLSIAPQLQAYSLRTPYPGVVSTGGNFFLIVSPEGYDIVDEELRDRGTSKVTVYKITTTGEPEKVWGVEGWYEYPHFIYLSDDGKTIVRVRELFLHEDGSYGAKIDDQDVISIYREGGKIAGYKATDLITDLNKGIQWGGHHHRWLQREGEKEPAIRWHMKTEYNQNLDVNISTAGYQYFDIQTLEGINYHFDLETGGILERKFIK